MFEIQNLTFFTEGNTYTGGWTEGERTLRYRVAPKRDEGLLEAWYWQEDKCFERAGETVSREFPLNDSGLQGIIAWLNEAWQGNAS